MDNKDQLNQKPGEGETPRVENSLPEDKLNDQKKVESEKEVVPSIETSEDSPPKEVEKSSQKEGSDIEKDEGSEELSSTIVEISEYEASQGYRLDADFRDESGDEEDEGEDNEEDEPVDEQTTLEELSGLTRAELADNLGELVKESSISKIKNQVALIKVVFLRKNKEEKNRLYEEFLKEGGNKEEFKPVDDPIEVRFNEAFNVYKENKKLYVENQEKIKKENLELKKDILEKLRELINSEETLKKTYDEFKALQAQWKEIGMVPAGEVSNLWQSYHFLVEKFFDKVKINNELRDLDLKKNLEQKIELCERAEELLLETSIIKSFKQLQKYHEEWKEIGPVPIDKREEIWERFKNTTDNINQRRKEFYEKLHEDQEKNLLAKRALCEKIEIVLTEEPSNMREWQAKTNEINELFKLWKSIGRAPKKHNDEVWNRFRTSLNTFFDNKKEYLNSIKHEQLNNYNLKLDLCVQAENIKDSSEWKQTTQELIGLQKEWKKIGPVPKKHSDKIWKRFRAACDDFFNRKSEYFKNIHEKEEDNLNLKKELVEKVKSHKYADDKAENLKVIKDYQRQFMEVGFVPIKEKDKVNKQFREAVNEQLEQLKISAVELDVAGYRNKVDTLKEAPEGNRTLKKELGSLSNRINKLREDILLWENNIGFLANSKKADVLREEFEKKIQKAKEDLALLEAKKKYLENNTK